MRGGGSLMTVSADLDVPPKVAAAAVNLLMRDRQGEGTENKIGIRVEIGDVRLVIDRFTRDLTVPHGGRYGKVVYVRQRLYVFDVRVDKKLRK